MFRPHKRYKDRKSHYFYCLSCIYQQYQPIRTNCHNNLHRSSKENQEIMARDWTDWILTKKGPRNWWDQGPSLFYARYLVFFLILCCIKSAHHALYSVNNSLLRLINTCFLFCAPEQQTSLMRPPTGPGLVTEAPAQDTEANTSRQKANLRLFALPSRICRTQLQQRIRIFNDLSKL